VAVLLRAAFAFGLLGGMPLVSDARDYFDLAGRLAEGRTQGPFYWPPGESMVLAAVFRMAGGPSVLFARAATVAISVGVVALTVLLTCEAVGRREARIAGWLAAVYGPSLLLSGQTYAQHLAALCLAAVAYFGLRAVREGRLVWFGATGLALGFGCLTRPSMASVVVAVLLAALAASRRPDVTGSGRPLLGAALAATVALAIALPVLSHNARAGAGWTISTNNERNLFLGNNPYTPDYKTSHLGQRSTADLDPQTRAYLESFYERPDARTAMADEAIRYMEDHPFRTARRSVNRALSFWGFDYIGSREIQRWRGWGTVAAMPLLLFEAGSYLLLAALALVGIILFRGRYDGRCAGWLAFVVVAYAAPYLVAFSGGAYHFPVIPLAFPFVAIPVAAGVREVRSRVASSHAGAVVLGLFALVQVQYAYYAFTMRG
jgi:4-amino-4-deoxy-L-arabinose transferase-like glycosyltransferase